MRMSVYVPECYSGPLTWADVATETLEVIEEFPHWKKMLEEIKQVALYLLIIFWQITKVDFSIPSFLPWEEDYSRFHTWKLILSELGVEKMDIAWFTIGNNWRRPEKVQAIAAKAGVEISLEVASKLVSQYQ